MASTGCNDGWQDEVLCHQHCLDCVRLQCPVLIADDDGSGSRPGTTMTETSSTVAASGRCPMVDCPQACGARFHECKAAEHELLCALVSAPCINREYGCTAVVRRHRLARHLAACPASAVVCTMEWNRRMLPADQAPAWARPLATGTAAVACCQSQLDVSWAARDERRLLQSFELADTPLAQSLRSPLTPGWPAVPFLQPPTCASDAAASSKDCQISVVARGSSAAAASGVGTLDGRLCTGETASAAISVNLCGRQPATRTLHAGCSPKRKTPAYHVQCSLCSARRGSASLDDADDTWLKSSILEGLNLDTGLTASSRGRLNVDGFRIGSSVEDSSGSSSGSAVGSASWRAPHVHSRPCSVHRDGIGDESGCLEGSTIREASESTAAAVAAVTTTSACAAFTLDLVTETYNSFRVKPVTMYTFRCAESFRRDEYASHYQNVHADVQAGLGGWFEWRCPLAAYGCSWSCHRFAATRANDRVVFSPAVDGFGVTAPGCMHPESCCDTMAGRSDSSLPGAAGAAASALPAPRQSTSSGCGGGNCAEKKVGVSSDSADEIASYSTATACPAAPMPGAGASQSDEGAERCGPDRLTALPEELLRGVLLYLDSFSLNNVALTCRVLRNACCRLLDRRGIVSLLWKKVLISNERPTWQSTSFVWTFSKHFASVDQWYFLSDAAMINHLATCTFNKELCFTHPDLAKDRMHDVDCDGRRKAGFGQQRSQCATERPDFF